MVVIHTCYSSLGIMTIQQAMTVNDTLVSDSAVDY